MAEKVFFILNKYAGSGFQSSVEEQITDACSLFNLEPTIENTNQKGHATELAAQALAAGFPRVFAMGGDGTVNEVAQALVHSTVAMGILPAGSGNGLARHLQIPLRTHRALGLLGEHKVLQMDTLLVNGHLCVNVAGIGFDAHVASLFGENGNRGLIGYTKLVFREFRRFKEFRGDVTVDNETRTIKSFIIALANSSQFGNNARVAPHASVNDGLMDVCFIQKVSLIQALPFAARMFRGTVDRSPYAEIVKAKSFRANFVQPMPYHIDGEPYKPTRQFEVHMQPGSLNMITPLKSPQ